MSMALPSTIVDALIIGGSHAGLSAALTLYRALHNTVIFDDHKPRNWQHSLVHLTPTWEHKSPEALRIASRVELLDSGLCRFVDASIKLAARLDNGLFQVTDSNGVLWHGRKILLAIGVKDVFPNLDGYELNYPQRIFPCMFQFGYEQRNAASAGLLAIDGLANSIHAPKLAGDAHKFADNVTIYTNANAHLASEISTLLQTDGIRVDDREIARLTRASDKVEIAPPTDPGIIVEFVNGEHAFESFLVHRALTELDHTLSDQLGLEYIQGHQIETFPPFCQTKMQGVFAAGDCASPMKIIPNAISMGAYAGAGIARELPKRHTGASRANGKGERETLKG